MRLYQTLEQQLKKHPGYFSNSGELKKWVVLNKVYMIVINNKIAYVLAESQKLIQPNGNALGNKKPQHTIRPERAG